MIDPFQELFDLCDRDGRPTGVRKLRPLVHRDGDWHRSFHCWVVAPHADDPRIVLQQRSPLKETWGGLWDVSVGGHYSAGEGIEGGIREIREELGLITAVGELIHVGWRREEVVYDDGLIEREVQDVFFLLRDVAVADLHPEPEEVVAVALIPTAVLVRLATGSLRTAHCTGGRVAEGGVEEGIITLRADSLVPRSGDYYRKATRVARALARGAATVRRRRWW